MQRNIDGRRRFATLLAAIAVVALIPLTAWAAFSIVPSPNPGMFNTIGGLVAFSPSEIWAIGQTSSPSYAGCHGRTLTARWNGAGFVEVPAAGTPICASVNGVAGVSTSDIWAVGSADNGRDTHIRHWNGTDWTVVPGATIPPPGSGGRSQRSTGLNAVAVLASNDAWAVGRAQFEDFSRHSLIEHWNGATWQLVNGPADPSTVLNGIMALASDNVWAVGTNGLNTLVTRWNGSTWTPVPSPNVNVHNILRGVTAVSPSDIWAVGAAVKDPFDGISVWKTLIEHWNGTSWKVVRSPNIGAGGNTLVAVAARAANNVWAVGYYDDVTGDIPIRRTLVLRWNGLRWRHVDSPNVGTGDNELSAVVAPRGTTDVWASGGSASGTVIERFTK